MIERLKDILNCLEYLNSLNDNKIEMKEFQEQYDNLNDFQKLNNELDKLTNKINISKHDNKKNEVEKMLFELHRILTTVEWHISEINDLNMTILKNYKSSNENN